MQYGGSEKNHWVIGGKVASLVNGYLEGRIFTNYKEGKSVLGAKKNKAITFLLVEFIIFNGQCYFNICVY